MRPPAEFTIEGWQTVHTIQLPAREKAVFLVDDLNLSPVTSQYLAKMAPGGIYLHQREAIRQSRDGKNVCIATGTASGKSLVFYATALEKLSKSPESRILAIYPTKALAGEQERRWKSAFSAAGHSAEVGRIEGGVSTNSRAGILRSSTAVIMTPDVIHSWLLSNLSEKAVANFLRKLSCIVVDEVHNYTGVFGSNSAFLFRRIQHAMNLLGASAQYLCASATIAEPVKHLGSLFGERFELIGPDLDTSPRHAVGINLMSPTTTDDQLTGITRLLNHLTVETPFRFLAFVDSRKQTEQISAILARSQEKEDDPGDYFRADHLERLDVLPFRSGYEAHDRRVIQERLSRKGLRGVISTSALELGMDIPSLDMGVLIGVPRSSTSLMQRIGRIGRASEGKVLILNTGSVYDEAVFSQPETILSRPLAEGALYLENPRIQYIHALCLARNGGEHDQIRSMLNLNETDEFASSVPWPDGFIDLCERERRGEITPDLQSMKSESGDDPNHIFPLRDVEQSFRVGFKRGPEQGDLGTLSYSQLMREAYPGAIYYYAAKPYRIYRVNVHSRTAQARNEKGYTSKPQALPTLVYPNLTMGNVFRGIKCSELIAIESNLQVRELICGYKERRGPNETNFSYPISVDGIYFSQPLFSRNYFTTGVVITHPALVGEKVSCESLAKLLFEAFLMTVPYERRDISVAVDRHRSTRGPITEGERFIAIYDQTYGSLRLSGRILDGDALAKVAQTALLLLDTQEFHDVLPETAVALEAICVCLASEPATFSFESSPAQESAESYVQVIMPGSKGLNLRRTNEEFDVEAVFFSPQVGGLAYRGRHASTRGETTKDIVPLDFIAEIPGESRIGQYNLNSGEIEEFRLL